MTGLLDLPNEILRMTLKWVSEVHHRTLFKVAAVNKRLNSVATPLLVRSWKCEHWNSKVEPFVTHLLRHPEYRREVRHLYIYPSNEEEPLPDGPRPAPCPAREEIAAAAAEALPELAERAKFTERILLGIHDPILVLLLTWATNLRTLHLVVPYFNPSEGDDLFTLMWVGQVVRKMGTVPRAARDSLPLMRLESVCFEHCDTESYVDHRLAAPFFHLPRMKSFSSWLMGGDCRNEPDYWSPQKEEGVTFTQHYEQYLTAFPVGTSGIESISLGEADLSLEAVSDVVRACRRLTSLSWELALLLTNDTLSCNGIAQLIMDHVGSLRYLSLNWTEPPDFGTPVDPAHGTMTLEECFQYLWTLEHINATWTRTL